MKLTKSKLQQIIKEELGGLKENHEPVNEAYDWMPLSSSVADTIVAHFKGDTRKALEELVQALQREYPRAKPLQGIMEMWNIPYDE
jgi:peptidoglycan/xylan/chitin deacetylase (PgdA/CDA1 family)